MTSTSPYKWLLMARSQRGDGSFAKGIWLQSDAKTPALAIEGILESADLPYASPAKKAFAAAAKETGRITVYPIYVKRDFEFITRKEVIVVEEQWSEV